MTKDIGFQANGLPTLIGSLPHEDHEKAQDLVLRYMQDIPIWVQLPKYPKERLLAQFVEGFPGLREEGNTCFFDLDSPEFEVEFLSFFEEYLSVTEGMKPIEDSIFSLSPERARGFFLFLERLKSVEHRPYALKGQITGPFTILTGIKDRAGKLSYYHQQAREAVVRGLSLKAVFQAKRMLELSRHAIVFLDEPALAGFGSSTMVGISGTEIQNDFKVIIDALHEAGALSGIHVCANTEWSLLLDPGLGLDIVSFDAFDYLDRFLLYRKEVLAFIERGGIIAWGFIPTQRPETIIEATIGSLMDRYRVAQEGIGLSEEAFMASSLITPSCGTGLLTKELAERVLSLTQGLSEEIRDRVNAYRS